jgi:hypothetical protein
MTTENQPIPHPLAGRNCGNCGYTAEGRLTPTDITPRKMCIRFPPSIVPNFTPQGVTLSIFQPPVDASMCCWEHATQVEIKAESDAKNSPLGILTGEPS